MALSKINNFVPIISFNKSDDSETEWLGDITIENYDDLVNLVQAEGYNLDETSVMLIAKVAKNSGRIRKRSYKIYSDWPDYQYNEGGEFGTYYVLRNNNLLHNIGVLDNRHQGSHKTYKYVRSMGSLDDGDTFSLEKNDVFHHNSQMAHHLYIFFGICVVLKRDELTRYDNGSHYYDMDPMAYLNVLYRRNSQKRHEIAKVTKLSTYCVKCHKDNRKNIELVDSYVIRD